MKFLLPLFLFLAIGCQMKPTKVVNQEAIQSESITAENLKKENAVLLDARPAFEFNLLHVPGAINVRWEDLSQNNPKSRGLLQTDLFALARRLSLIGIDPNTKVVVLGKGTAGQGEEGRVAWTLKVLGVKNVYTLVHNSYREMNPTKEIPPVQNKPYWKPEVQEGLMTELKSLQALAAKADLNTVILDVRSPEEFAQRNLSQEKKVKAKVVNLDWKKFFTSNGLPQKDVEKTLAALGISKDINIVVISNHGVRSGAVTYALGFLGYNKSSNFAGGYEQWK
ncbi:sulfurtransferase [Bdellovibrio reynosensis]|uniref:ABC transporter ATP-binding protein n=1 Tax=Bdellovibrio reynosensis TaxID=2835041 RepID=A0ABY4CAI5_9BACT|nr:rhodanese-like domain-containing protein [Bdellovibrio reynosensis]UOF01734.1 ABC transporter ATP-binding protein [Bdellovibrio reynosensis]